MMNLAMGLAAVDEYFKEGDRRKTREYTQALRDSELSTLPDATDARRSGFRDTTETNAARARLRPRQTANSERRLGIEGTQLEGVEGRLPTTEATLDATAKGALADVNFTNQQQPVRQATTAANDTTARDTAQFGLSQLPVTQETTAIRNATVLDTAKTEQQVGQNRNMAAVQMSGVELEQLPMKIAQARASGAVDEMGGKIKLIGGIVDAIASGNQSIVAQYVQRSIDTGLFPEIAGRRVGQVGTMRGADGKPVVVALDANGQELFRFTKENLDQARAAGQKIELKTVNAGDSLVKIQGGTVTPMYTAPESVKTANAKKPALQQNLEFLQEKFKMTPQQALDYLNQGKTETKQQFLMRHLGRIAQTGRPTTQQDVADANTLYEQIQQATGTNTAPSAAPGAARAPAAISPELQRILGIQSQQ